MRIHCRLLLGMFGLAVAVPSLAVAAPFGDDAGRRRWLPVQPRLRRGLTIITGYLAGDTASSASGPT